MLSPITLGVVGAVVLVVFGPRRLPEIANSLGKSLNEFKRGLREAEGSFQEGFNQAPSQPQTMVAQTSEPQPVAPVQTHVGEVVSESPAPRY